MSNEMIVFLICVLISVVGLGQALFKAWLLVNKPESWKAMQEAEERKRAKKREAIERAAMGSARIARFFLKR